MWKFALQASLLSLSLFMAQAWAEGQSSESDGGAIVNVQKNGDTVVIDLSMTIAATPKETWDVLVDFDHMTDFLKNLQSSKILEKNSNVWKVAQKGQTSHAGFSFAFESVRDVTLKPFESLQSHLVSGTLKKHDTLTLLAPVANGTRLTYHAESISGAWVPPLLGTSVVESEVRKQYTEIQAEVLRRKGANRASN